MTSSLTITVPGPPKPLQRHKTVRMGNFSRGVDPEKNKLNKAALGWYGKIAMNSRPLMKGPLAMSIEFRFTKPKGKIRVNSTPFPYPDGKPDVDNLTKLVLDGLNGIVYVDDAQVVTLKVTKRWANPTGPETVIQIEAQDV